MYFLGWAFCSTCTSKYCSHSFRAFLKVIKHCVILCKGEILTDLGVCEQRSQSPSTHYSDNSPTFWRGGGGVSSPLLRLPVWNPEVKLTAAAATFCLWEPHWCSSPSPHRGRTGFPSAVAEAAGGFVQPYISLNVGESLVTTEGDHICATAARPYIMWLQKPEETHLISHICLCLSGRCILGNATVSQARIWTGAERVTQKVKRSCPHSWTSTTVSSEVTAQLGNYHQGLYSVWRPTVTQPF